ncbi:hypothetical protein MKW98_025272 [Papaver atlanticum]|uniref:Uncharacterized protein n=1 Tax=Papaver atlanticum TaxID=357466 RepID=A0AAD4S1V2_9MAGN|nr:hypothetical protein MKW98_025272 [Papaver atlanticum]
MPSSVLRCGSTSKKKRLAHMDIYNDVMRNVTVHTKLQQAKMILAWNKYRPSRARTPIHTKKKVSTKCPEENSDYLSLCYICMQIHEMAHHRTVHFWGCE